MSILQKNQNPETIEYLQSQNQNLTEMVATLQLQVKYYEEQFRLLKNKMYGKSSEKTDENQLSLDLFNEVEKESNDTVEELTMETVVYQRKKKKGKRAEDLSKLPSETIEYRLAAEDQVCPCCDGALHEMSQEVRKELTIIPAQVKVVEHKQFIYACRQCQKDDIETPILTARMPKPAFPKSVASPSLVAFIMAQKYTDSLPLYRQERGFERMGISIPRQNMANWIIYAAEKWLYPLYERMKTIMLAEDILYADETTLKVLREPGRTASQISYLWLYRTGPSSVPIVFFEYCQTREKIHPERMLDAYNGYLHADGYSGYSKIANVTHVGCWAHCRRKFIDALKVGPKESKGKLTTANEGLDFCNRLYVIERNLKKCTPEERHKLRLEQSAPILKSFHEWLIQKKAGILPNSVIGKAITYSLNQWEPLNVFLKDGRLEIDNNRSERSIKAAVIGRKNWLFSTTPKGAFSSAIAYSIVETAKENNLNPFEYLRYLFEQLPNINLSDLAELDSFLPWSENIPEQCRITK
ncbi:MAG: IS66 family transposase [Bacilli bacterium]